MVECLNHDLTENEEMKKRAGRRCSGVHCGSNTMTIFSECQGEGRDQRWKEETLVGLGRAKILDLNFIDENETRSSYRKCKSRDIRVLQSYIESRSKK